MPRRSLTILVAALMSVSMAAASRTAAAAPQTSALATSPELSETSQLADRRSIVIGDRFYEVGAEDGSYPAEGFHTRGEMGGMWSMPIKLLDGVWFGVNGSWLHAQKYTNGWGYARMDLGSQAGVQISRTDFAPDGLRAGVIGLTLTATSRRTITLTLDAHSELMLAYPWGETTPYNQLTYNLPDTGDYSQGSLVFREQGTPPAANVTAHDWAAVVGSSLTPSAHQLGPNFRGPQDPAVICPSGTVRRPHRAATTRVRQGHRRPAEVPVKLSAGSRRRLVRSGRIDQGQPGRAGRVRRGTDQPVDAARGEVAARRQIDAQPQWPAR